MVATLYDPARDKFARGALNWVTTTEMRVVLIGPGYVFSAAHEFLSSIAAADRIAISTLGGRVTDGTGVCDGSDVRFSQVGGTQNVVALAIYQLAVDGLGNQDDAASQLIGFHNQAPEFPLTPDGADILITWDNGPNKIFKL